MSKILTDIEKIENLLQNSTVKTITMYRVNFGNKRGYVTKEPFLAYSGLTGALSSATFKGNVESKRIGKWRDKMIESLGGREQQESYLQSMGDFGTICHECLVRIKESGKLNWKEEQEYAYEYFHNSAKENGIAPNSSVIRAQVFEYCKAAASILQFCYDKVENIYAIEAMCKSDELMIATPVDFVARLKDGNIVSVNLKTSSQIGDGHREQVAVEKYLWNETYPDKKVAKTGILRTKDWLMKKGIPTYEFELLDMAQEEKILYNTLNRLKICKDDPNSTYLTFPTEVQVFTGITALGEKPEIETKTLEQIFNESYYPELQEAETE